MKTAGTFAYRILALALVTFAGNAMAAFNSGSTGADGAFNPTESQEIQLPPNGVFNYTTVNIPSGVTITYKKNAANTPVVILASDNVTIAGTIDVSAKPPLDVSDISGPGLAGPGGYDGGRGGQSGGDAANWITGFAGPNVGRAGTGPGGGGPGGVNLSTQWGRGVGAGGGGAYGGAPNAYGGSCPATPGVTYGNLNLLPLVGGSGGGGGAGGAWLPGAGGGGGGGAIIVASSGTISVTGTIAANGGTPRTVSSNGRGALGGGGSGGAIRLVATKIEGNGTISAAGGNPPVELTTIYGTGTTYVVCSSQGNDTQRGGPGRIRLESETLTRTAATVPPYVGGSPSVLFVPGLPTISITSIGGVNVPAMPTGNGDVNIPSTLPNPVTVTFTTRGVTVGSLIKLRVQPPIGAATTVTSAATTGTVDNATASVDVNLPAGNSILQASVTYTVLASVGDAMSKYAQGERVEQVRLSATLGGPSIATLITVSGKEYDVPASVLAAFTG